MIVGSELKESIRTHHDIEQDTAKHIKKATKFYEGLAARCCEKGITLDIFAACLDQIGIMEMRSIINKTNGYIVLADSFSSMVFKQCLNRVFSKDEQGCLKIGFNCILEVNVSRELKVCGLIGPAVSANKKGPAVGDMEIGVGNTCAWKLASITPNTTVAVYFEVAPQVFHNLTLGSKLSARYLWHHPIYLNLPAFKWSNKNESDNCSKNLGGTK